jgi:predicted transcriptional regulator
MSTTLTIRLPDSLAARLQALSEASGIAKARIVTTAIEETLEKATKQPDFMRLAGVVSLGGRRSERKGFSRG